ncbi:H(+)-transporting V1 sector ATPase subunit H [Malassezia furfur]|uniref:H(+)-transporting V1 sector ATPase subunit H n=1 Tax=Malassezia furfur TaxID=55194 RepID=A0ABY8EI67_MALFU|nr:H(+)-transporting V1 sector ATPase subunit H [Malassezia furfur]
MPEEKRGQQAVSTSPLMPLDNGWLKETADKVRARQTAWEGYQRAELISSEELQMLRDAEQAGRDKQLRTVLDKEPQYAALYTRLFGKLSRADTIQQVVLLADDLVQAAPDRLDAFLDAPQLYASLLK